MHESEITFVVQGPVFTGQISTKEVLASIRTAFPNAKIILSTFEQTPMADLSGLECDMLVLSEDPGDFTPGGAKPLNINRQIVSTKAGLDCVNTRFAVKTRTDLLFGNRELLNKFDWRNSPRKILVTNLSSRDPDFAVRIPYWICDFLYMGETADLKFVFNAQLYELPEFEYAIRNNLYSRYCPDVVSIFPPELYFGLRILKRFCPHITQPSNIIEAEHMSRRCFWDFMVNHIELVGFEEIGLSSLKYPLPFENHSVMLTSNKVRWLKRVSNRPFGGILARAISVVTKLHYLYKRALYKIADFIT